MISRILFLAFLSAARILCADSCYSQTVRVTAVGVWDMSGNTIEKAKTLALENAKENALRKAGVQEEFIISNTGAISDRVNHFISYSNSELLGEISDYKILKSSVKTEGRLYYYEVEIEAVIKKGKVKRDLEFDVSIDGIKNSAYRDGEAFQFSLKPYKDCYANIFWLDETGAGALVYPNVSEASELLRTGDSYPFPRTQHYKAKKESKDRIEIVSLIFVFTRKHIPFTNECTLENIQRWIMTIPSDTRLLKYNTIILTD